MGWSVDYSGDYAYIDGVGSGTYTPAGGSGETVQCKPTQITRGDLNGGILGVSPSDRVFIVWGITTGMGKPQDTLTFDSVAYSVIGATERGDDAQQRIICRKQV